MRIALDLGTRVQWQGDEFEVVALEGSAVNLSSRSGRRVLLEFAALLEDPGFGIVGGVREPVRAPCPQAGALETIVPRTPLRRAEKRLEHVREVETGYRSGQRDDARPDEPKPGYDPEQTTKDARVRAKAGELAVHPATIHRWCHEYREHGLAGLVDKRILSPTRPGPELEPSIADALEEALRRARRGSTAKKSKIRKLLNNVLVERSEHDLSLPSESTLNRAIDAADRRHKAQRPRRRVNSANQPKRPYGRITTSRPGELVLIDSTDLNIAIIDPFTLRVDRGVLTAGMCHQTRSALALRVTAGAPKAVDASLLLLDMIRPTPFRDRWPSSARWRYHGVPETLLARVKEGWGVQDLAAKPLVRPDMAVADGAWINRSREFLLACGRLEIDLQIARPRRATDKAQIERLFGTMDPLMEALPGYLGRDVMERGEYTEADAMLFGDEAEDILYCGLFSDYHHRPHSGLEVPGRPSIKLSPNEAYDEAIARCGFVYVPPDRNLFFELLPTVWRRVEHDGVTIGKVKYDSEVLEPLRMRRSDHAGRAKGRWPFRHHPRDRSRIFYLNEGLGEWIAVPWRSERAEDRPFGQLTVEYAKRRLVERGGDSTNADSMARYIEAVLDEIESSSENGKRPRRRLARELADAQRARDETPEVSTADSAPPDPDQDLRRARPWTLMD